MILDAVCRAYGAPEVVFGYLSQPQTGWLTCCALTALYEQSGIGNFFAAAFHVLQTEIDGFADIGEGKECDTGNKTKHPRSKERCDRVRN